MKISKNWLLVAGVVTTAVVFAGTRVLASDAWTIETSYGTNTIVTFDGSGASNDSQGTGGGNAAVIQAIMSWPCTPPAHSYTTYSLLVGDASGSMDIYGPTSALGSYVPAVGDAITVTGNWSPYHCIPEIGSPIGSLSKVSSGNALIPIQTPTIPTILANGALSAANNNGGWYQAGASDGQYNEALQQNLAGYFVEIQDVMVSGQGTLTAFPAGNYTFTITDGANNSMTMYFWETSYACDGVIAGAPIPTWPVNIYGLLTAYPTKVNGTNAWQDEFIPDAFVGAIPEPSSFMLAGMGLLSLIAVMRRRRS